jgi:hypothetical protein
MVWRNLLILVLLEAVTGCGAGANRPPAAKPSADGPASTSSPSATTAEEPDWWTRYDLPAPGSDGYGVTVHRDAFTPTGAGKLTGFSPAERNELFSFVERLYDFGFWDLASQPTKPSAHRYDAFFSADSIRSQVQAVRNGSTGFGTVHPNPETIYGFEVRDLKVKVLDQAAAGGDEGRAVAMLRLSWTNSFIGAHPPGTKIGGQVLEPTEFTTQLVSEVVVGDLGSGPGQFVVLGWKIQVSDVSAVPLPQGA